MSKTLLSGNEAIAQGAWEAGVKFGVGYPGTPSTETLQYFGSLPETYAEWAPNEKVALEVAIGLSMAGKRSLVTMKHVGVNVAADPLFTIAYIGVRGGLVLLAADDPGMHSSQNEQDSRNYAAFARVMMLEPSDSAEASRFAKLAFSLSEQFDMPAMIRSTVRISHSKSLVEVGEPDKAPEFAYEKDLAKWVSMPAMARKRRVDLDERIARLSEYAGENTNEGPDAINRIERRSPKVGVITSGVSYQYVREALPDASVLKIGMPFPLHPDSIRAFADSVEKVYVIEEACAYLETAVKSFGIAVEPLDLTGRGELSPEIIRRAFCMSTPVAYEPDTSLPPRPPILCPGCPHRPVFAELRRIKAVVTGDIGCYTLGALAPLSAVDSCVDMGASVSMAHGLEISGALEGRPIVATIGDSTFTHSGMTSLLNTVYNGGAGTVAILDNRITAMTGHQGNPVNGITLQGRQNVEMDLETVVRALGVPRVRTVDAQDIRSIRTALREETSAPELSVIVFRAPCALLLKERKEPYRTDHDKCTACGTCIALGCPAIAKSETDGTAHIDEIVCVGCGQCVQVCAFGAISRAGDKGGE